MHVDLQALMFADESSRGSRVVEMIMGEQNGVKVRDLQTVSGKFSAKCGNAGSRSGVDKYRGIVRAQECRGDGAGTTSPLDINDGSCLHAHGSLA